MQDNRFDLAFENDPKRVLRGRVESPGSNSPEGPWAMVLHGFKGFMDWGFFPLLSRGLAEAGITSIRFNTSGSGVGEDMEYYSDPEAFLNDTYSRQLEDIALVREAVEAGEFGPLDPEQGVLIGHSRGGGMGVLHAAEHEYRGLVTWASIAEPKFFPEKLVNMWKGQGYLEIPNTRTGHMMRIGMDAVRDVEENLDRLQISEVAAKILAPALVVHGTADETVSVESARKLAAAFPNGELALIEGAGHTFGAGHPLKGVTPELAEVLALTLNHACTSLGLRMV